MSEDSCTTDRTMRGRHRVSVAGYPSESLSSSDSGYHSWRSTTDSLEPPHTRLNLEPERGPIPGQYGVPQQSFESTFGHPRLPPIGMLLPTVLQQHDHPTPHPASGIPPNTSSPEHPTTHSNRRPVAPPDHLRVSVPVNEEGAAPSRTEFDLPIGLDWRVRRNQILDHMGVSDETVQLGYRYPTVDRITNPPHRLITPDEYDYAEQKGIGLTMRARRRSIVMEVCYLAQPVPRSRSRKRRTDAGHHRSHGPGPSPLAGLTDDWQSVVAARQRQ